MGWVQIGEPSTPRDLYRKYCSVCHGKGGDGKSAVAPGMMPPPGDFTAPGALVTLTRKRMMTSVTEGRPGTAMASWKNTIKPDEIAGVVDYIRNTLMLSSRAKDASPGRRLFAEKCSVCHGDGGDVAIWAQGGLVPAPRNFTTDNARWELTRDRMIFSISYGRPETAMPSWSGRLTRKEIESVVSYIRESFMFPDGVEREKRPRSGTVRADGSRNGRDHAHDHYDTSDMFLPMPYGLTGQMTWGKTFFEAQCAICHGKQGDGKGPRSEFVYPKPRDFHHPSSRHRLNRPHLFEVIAKGVLGSEMPAWEKVLTAQEIAHLAEFIFQTFIRPAPEDALGVTHATTGHHAHTGESTTTDTSNAAHAAGQQHTEDATAAVSVPDTPHATGQNTEVTVAIPDVAHGTGQHSHEPSEQKTKHTGHHP